MNTTKVERSDQTKVLVTDYNYTHALRELDELHAALVELYDYYYDR